MKKIKDLLTDPLIISAIIMLILILMTTSPAKAGVVRTVYLDDSIVENVYLRLGQTTVLNFLEKPTRVAIGNKNYFNVEYVNNDLTIQPLQAITDSNCFVYGKYHRYGFILKISGNIGKSYDDLIKVKWKDTDNGAVNTCSCDEPKKVEVRKQSEQLIPIAQSPPSVSVTAIPVPTPTRTPSTEVVDDLKVILQKSIWLAERNLLLVDLEITNQKNEAILLKDLKIVVSGIANSKSPPLLKESVFESNQLSTANDKTRCRLIILVPITSKSNNSKKDDISIEITFNAFKKVIIVKGGTY
ncbi:MAG: hypothetical protein HQK49_21815 [Oligoflexia bacterium]|nr:hypothetical protein [Oligoflexia bacterium]